MLLELFLSVILKEKPLLKSSYLYDNLTVQIKIAILSKRLIMLLSTQNSMFGCKIICVRCINYSYNNIARSISIFDNFAILMEENLQQRTILTK